MAATLNINFIIIIWPFNRLGWVARYKSAGNLSLKKPPQTVRHGFTFPNRASYSCHKLLTAEIVRQTNAWSTARVLKCSDRFYPFHSLKSVQYRSGVKCKMRRKCKSVKTRRKSVKWKSVKCKTRRKCKMYRCAVLCSVQFYKLF